MSESSIVVTGRDLEAITGMSECRPPGYHYSRDFLAGRLDNRIVNFCGVVSDLLSPSQTRGTDWQLTFNIIDPNGQPRLPVKFFKQQEALPTIRLNGDVVFLEGMKVTTFAGQRTLLSSHATKWWVLRKDYITPHDMEERQKVMEEGQMVFFSSPEAGPLTFHMRQWAITYRSWIKGLFPLNVNPDTAHLYEEPFTTKQSTSKQASTNNTSNDTGAPQAAAATSKYRDKQVTIANIKVEGAGSFYDLKGTVVKLFYDLRQDVTELYITDYTQNDLLHDHQPETNVTAAEDKWPGPYGKHTLRVDLFSPHGPWARSNVALGDIVRMNNVRVKWSSNSSEIEGSLWRDTQYPDKVQVRVLEHDKGDFLRKFREEFVKKNIVDTSSVTHIGTSKRAKKQRARKKEQLARQAAAEEKDGGKKSGTTPAPAPAPVDPTADFRLNPSVVFDAKKHGIDRESPVDLIVNNPRREFVTPGGNNLTLPFINVKHMAHVWVVDFYPHDLKDFTEQVSTVDGKTKWRWNFQLVVCDADIDKIKIKKGGLKPKQVIPLVIRDKEAITLFGLQPHDLRTKRGETTIKTLQEKLFILWGDLAEQKEKYLSSNPKIKADHTFNFITHMLHINNRPFTAGVREYGVEDKAGVLERDRWSKYWEIFDTKIA